MQPTAELLWLSKKPRDSATPIALRTLPIAAHAHHAFGTTSIFEEHGVATELLRVYKHADRDAELTIRPALAFNPTWKAAGNALLRSTAVRRSELTCAASMKPPSNRQ
jgi:hypothetical protein